jgi:hypothetical protein
MQTMLHNGYIRFPRVEMTDPIFQDAELWKLWCLCRFQAGYRERQVMVAGQKEPVVIGPGQFVTSRDDLHALYYPHKSRANKTSMSVWRWLERLQDSGFLSIKTCNKYTIVTICDADIYEDEDSQNVQQNVQDVFSSCSAHVQQTPENRGGNVIIKEKKEKKEENTPPIIPPKGESLERQCLDLHDYLLARTGRAWKFATWKHRYRPRVEKYGLDACKKAVDGFVSDEWCMREKIADAPDYIFRSDKQLEKFMARVQEQRPQAEPEREQRKAVETDRITAYRARLEREQARALALFRDRLIKARDDIPISEHSWTAFIAPLLVVDASNGRLILYHEQAQWVSDHYLAYLQPHFSKPIVITDTIPESPP